jgi:phosphoenolpyruvate synthase/pyruvate phosphate dikinase
MPFVKTLKSVQAEDLQVAGDRAVDLAALLEKEFSVPPCFVLTNEAFEAFILHNKLQARVAEALTIKQTEASYGIIRELILNSPFPEQIAGDLSDAYESLGVDPDAPVNDIVEATQTPFVIAILSPNYTTPTETNEGIVLNVRGMDELLLAVKECWACLFSPAMQRYRADAGIGNRNLNTGVIIEGMPAGEVSAEAWSATGPNTEELTVKASYGALDIGTAIAKDEFRLTREYLRPIYQSVAVQTEMLSRDEEDRLGKVPIGQRGREQKVTDRIVAELARLAKKASQALDRHVKLFFNIRGETVTTLLCARLLLTPGSVRLQSYHAEEAIEEEPPAVPISSSPPPEEMEEETAQESAKETTQKMTEETATEIPAETAEETGNEIAPEPTPAPVPRRTVIEEEDALVEADEETGEESITSEEVLKEERRIVPEAIPEPEPEALASPPPAAPSPEEGKRTATSEDDSIFSGIPTEDAAETQRWTLERAYQAVTESLAHAYERRFHGVPPPEPLEVFQALSDEVIIPHEELIGQLLRIRHGAEHSEQELEAILAIIDGFLREFGE